METRGSLGAARAGEEEDWVETARVCSVSFWSDENVLILRVMIVARLSEYAKNP